MDLKAIQSSMVIGSENYTRIAEQVKEFLRFNGYSQTLQSVEKEEEKVLARSQADDLDGINLGGAANDSAKPVLDVRIYTTLYSNLTSAFVYIG